MADNTLISATAAYAKDRSLLRQLLSNTLDLYGISLVNTAQGGIVADSGDSGVDGTDGS